MTHTLAVSAITNCKTVSEESMKVGDIVNGSTWHNRRKGVQFLLGEFICTGQGELEILEWGDSSSWGKKKV